MSIIRGQSYLITVFNFFIFKRLIKVTDIFLFSLCLVIVLLGGSGCKRSTQQVVNNETNVESNNITPNKYHLIRLGHFFPSVWGNLSAYDIKLPSLYINHITSDGTSVWGEPADIKAILSPENPNYLYFDKAQSGIFRIEFSQDIGIDKNGQIAGTDGPITQKDLEKIGVNDIHMINGLFHGIQAVPVLAITGKFVGKFNNNPIYIAYIYSPVNGLVVRVSLQGGNNQATNTAYWNTFVGSLDIRPIA